MKNLLKICSVIEVTTGIAVITAPINVLQLLFAADVIGITLTISRFAGISLISLGIACWPAQSTNQAAKAMFVYNLLVAIFFIYIGLVSSSVGILLWPVAILHLGLAVLLIRGLFTKQN